MSEAPGTVLGIGNAIVDVLAEVDDAFLERHEMAKGSMTLIDAERAAELYRGMAAPVERSGGSAANTVAGIASLGGRGAYIGRVRDDSLGATFREDIRAAGVGFRTPAASSGPPTARCMIFVTPDAQRTMQTFLGASAELGPEDIDREAVGGAAITLLEGYLWDPPPAKEAFRKAAQIAHETGGKVALSLSDEFCVDRHREEFRELVDHQVDILFANEAEAISLYRTKTLDQAIAELAGRCEIAVVTLGARGSLVLADGETISVEAEPVRRVVDTTGAGDLYAAGFLYGVAAGKQLAVCGRLGAIAAGEIIGHYGARPETSLAELVRERLG